jgi:hypothetical protein
VESSGLGTYNGRGTLKQGCNPSEHAIAYFSGTDPGSCYMPGEYQSGMTKEPIEIVPVDASIHIRSESRIRFGKTYPIQMNVKVKDIGKVHESHISKLLRYWIEENDYSGLFDGSFATGSSYHMDEPRYVLPKSSPSPGPESDSEDVALLRRDALHHLSADRFDSRLTGDLFSGPYYFSLMICY